MKRKYENLLSEVGLEKAKKRCGEIYFIAEEQMALAWQQVALVRLGNVLIR